MFEKLLILLVVNYFSSCESTLIGGPKPVDLSDHSQLEHITELALIGVKAIAAKRSSSNSSLGEVKEVKAVPISNFKPSSLSPKYELKLKYSLLNITSARRQLVAGLNYFISIEMQPEECSSTSGQDDSLMCDLKREVCEMTIWEKPWENFVELTNYECQTRSLTNNLGSRKRIPNDDPGARKALDFAIDKMNKLNKNPVYHTPVVQNIYKQLVSGIKYTFEFEYAPTNCLIKEENMEEFKSDECKVDQEKESLSCVVSVLDQFWLADDESETNSDESNSKSKPSRYEVTLTNCT